MCLSQCFPHLLWSSWKCNDRHEVLGAMEFEEDSLVDLFDWTSWTGFLFQLACLCRVLVELFRCFTCFLINEVRLHIFNFIVFEWQIKKYFGIWITMCCKRLSKPLLLAIHFAFISFLDFPSQVHFIIQLDVRFYGFMSSIFSTAQWIARQPVTNSANIPTTYVVGCVGFQSMFS